MASSVSQLAKPAVAIAVAGPGAQFSPRGTLSAGTACDGTVDGGRGVDGHLYNNTVGTAAAAGAATARTRGGEGWGGVVIREEQRTGT